METAIATKNRSAERITMFNEGIDINSHAQSAAAPSRRTSVPSSAEQADFAVVTPPLAPALPRRRKRQRSASFGEPRGIDKSVLMVAAPRRYRNKDHLRFVVQQPCLVCGRTPSDPHHLRFMQPRALGRKVSDRERITLAAIWDSHVCDGTLVLCFQRSIRLALPGSAGEWHAERPVKDAI